MRDSNSHESIKFSKEAKYNDPPNSRLFIVCGKSIAEEDFWECFSKYGTVTEVWLVKDRVTGEPKGVTYIKFSKTSEAALAMEEMNGKCIGDHPRPLKVLIAHNREQGSRRDQNEEERLLRLFVVVPKSMSEHELKEHFSTFGDIDYVNIVKDRQTKESKGFGYVKYHRMSHSALAFENCDRSFKPMFADPRPSRDQATREMGSVSASGRSVSSGFDPSFCGASGVYSPSCVEMGFPSGADGHLSPPSAGAGPGAGRLLVTVAPSVTREQLWRLCDLVPGLDFVDLRRGKSGQSQAVVQYTSGQSAAYACDKLHGFEYPPGQRLMVKLDSPHHSEMAASRSPAAGSRLPAVAAAVAPPMTPRAPAAAASLRNDLAHLAETIAQATSLIQAAGLTTRESGGAAADASQSSFSSAQAQVAVPAGASVDQYDPSYCSITLPAPQPLVSLDSVVEERLFIVCQPSPPPLYALKDVFARFGGLIDVYILNGKTCGYVKYAVKESADKAMEVLHGQEVCGSRMKVMKADPSSSSDWGRKRMKIDDTRSS